jgi:Protein of unknown function (DUF1501)
LLCAADAAADKATISSSAGNPLAARPQHFPATAKSVIFLMIAGGPSQMGCESDNLPALVVLAEPDGKLKGGTPCWGNGFLPAIYQGSPIQSPAAAAQGAGPPILYLDRPRELTADRQRRLLDLSQWLNARHRDSTPAATSELDSRIAAYELAFRMQAAAPEAVEFGQETAATHSAYGLDDPATHSSGVRCLIARRLVERGVRFVQVISGSGGWLAAVSAAAKPSARRTKSACGPSRIKSTCTTRTPRSSRCWVWIIAGSATCIRAGSSG